eukprot:jgi/Botrbrau1/13043/Bobra.0187s0006.1
MIKNPNAVSLLSQHVQRAGGPILHIDVRLPGRQQGRHLRGVPSIAWNAGHAARPPLHQPQSEALCGLGQKGQG